MSLLHQDSEEEEELDDAARGEAFTKGSSHVVWASIAAAVVVTVAIAIYVIAGEKPPPATGAVLQMWALQRHGETSGIDANGAPMAKENFDQLLVFAHIRVHNQSKYPLFLEDILANLTQADGVVSISAGSEAQYEEVFLAYPDLEVPRAALLAPRTTIAPGATLDGNAFWALRMSKQEWEARRALNFTCKFQYQPSLTLTPPHGGY